MRVTSIIMQNSNADEVMTLAFRDPTSPNPYICKAIVGLDADEITPSYYGESLVSKESYFNLSLKPRNVVLRLALNPDFAELMSYSGLRDAVYRAISSSRTGSIKLIFVDDEEEVAYVTGFVVKLEAPQSTSVAEIQLTLKVDDPLLKCMEEISEPVDFSDHSHPFVEDHMSTAPHGFTARFKFTSNSSAFIIQDSDTPEWKFHLLYSFLADDELLFSSKKNDRYVIRKRSGVELHIADKIQPGSIWPIIFPGHNSFVNTDVGTWEEIMNCHTYWGV